MSLYDDLGVGASDTKTEGWSKNFKLLQSQLKVKKAALTQAKVGEWIWWIVIDTAENKSINKIACKHENWIRIFYIYAKSGYANNMFCVMCA